MAARCLASLQRTLLPRNAASGLLKTQPAAGSQWINAPGLQQQRRGAGQRLRVVSSASNPLWDDDSKQRINVYNDYTIYKGKAALSMKVIKPTWTRVASGLALAREGTLLLEFANAVDTQKYDWEKKQVFALSAIECATVLEGTDGKRDVSFYHDPNKGGEGEGSISKTLNIKAGQQGGWFFTINVNQHSNKSSVSCPVTDTELRTMKIVMTFLVPKLLGFDEPFNGAPVVVESGTAAQAPPPPAAAAGGGPPF